MPQQQLCARDVTVGRACMQRGGPTFIPRVHVCVIQEKELDDLRVRIQEDVGVSIQ
jgi:hypothetical protein